ncbi:MAG: type II toxin-antitoxin system HicB family antitoxin [Defluviitaleaceae bacterium]|nr:type II toxin-antitoxin system HicB family antitoxin [Defluviitaleaceae bacterium]
MRKYSYFAVFEPAKNGGFGVYFPDLPGCASYGDDFEKATKMAEEALGFHLYGIESDNDELPKPTANPQQLQIEPETEPGYIISVVTVYPSLVKNQIENRAVKTNVTIPAWLKEIAEEQGINFSQLLQTALKERLNLS